MLNIHGFQTLTLLDYPGYVAATIFLGGCNFLCPFCQNSDLVISEKKEPLLSEEEVFTVLKKRKGLLDGVCVSGGEPTLSKDLPCLLSEIKALGLKTKLDTNGSHPEIIRSLHKEGLLDYVAMDIKSSPEHYAKVSGCPSLSVSAIRESVSYLMNSGLSYEFRTTVVRELHCKEDFVSIGKWISGCNAYYLQAYQDSPSVLQPGFSSYTRKELEEFRQLLQESIPQVGIRGID